VVGVAVEARLRELDVEHDQLRTVMARPVDDVGVEATRKGPLLLHVAEGLVGDVDDDDVARRPLRPADLEARVDCGVLEVAREVRQVGDDGETGQQRADREEENPPEPYLAGHATASSAAPNSATKWKLWSTAM